MSSRTPGTTVDGPGPTARPQRLRWSRYTGVYLLLFLIGTETFLVSPLLPTIADSVGVSETAAASTVTAYTLVYALTAPFLGALSDRYGRRPTIVAGAVLFLFGNVLAAVAGTLTVLVVARIAGALGAGLAGPSIWAHLAETAPGTLRGRAVGMGGALFSAGQVLGVPAGGFLAGWGGWRTAFWALSALSLLVLPLVATQTRPRSTPPQTPLAGAVRLSSVFTVWRDGVLARLLLVVFLLQAANLGAYTFLGSVLHDRFGLSVSGLGSLGVLVGVGSAVGSLAAGRLGDRARGRGAGLVGDAAWIPVWTLTLGAALVVAALGSPLAVPVVAVLVWFFASGAFGTHVQTLLLNARPALGATASSWNSATLYAGASAGVALIGLTPRMDAGSAVVGAALALLATGITVPLILRLRRAADAAAHSG